MRDVLHQDATAIADTAQQHTELDARTHSAQSKLSSHQVILALFARKMSIKISTVQASGVMGRRM